MTLADGVLGQEDSSRVWQATPLGWLLLFLVLYAVSVSFVGISGDFPLNDDWAYGVTTKVFATTGVFQPSSWSAIPLISEVIFATPVCLLSKCGYDDLRLVTLVASGLLIVGSFLLLRAGGLGLTIALIATALVAFNPVAYALSFTFMSDVLFAALLTLSALLFAIAIRDNLWRWAAVATIVAISATLTRQLGLCVAIAFLTVKLLQSFKEKSLKPGAVMYAIPLLACGLALVLLRYWLETSGKLPALYDTKLDEIAKTVQTPLTVLKRIGHNFSVIVLYLGLFSLPLTVVTSDIPLDARSRWMHMLPSALALVAVAVCVIDMLALGRLMPIGGNIFAAQGIGPLLLKDEAVLALGNAPKLPKPFWFGVTLLSIFGAYLFVKRLVAQTWIAVMRIWRSTHDNRPLVWLFIAIASAAYIAPLLLIPFYDRYLVPVFPFALYLLLANEVKIHVGGVRAVTAVTLCFLTMLYSVVTVHDYMSWNRARWAAISMLEDTRRISSSLIDGGLEYNGLRAYDPAYVKKEGKSWWWIQGDDYQITFGPIDGLIVDQRFEYRTLLPPTSRSIFVLKRPMT